MHYCKFEKYISKEKIYIIKINPAIMLQTNHVNMKFNFLYCLIFFLTLLVVNSCKKTDSLVRITNEIELEKTPENFFKLPTDASPILKRIVNELERQNKTKEFITAFIAKEGYPIWNKSRIEKNKLGNTAGFDTDGIEDTTVYIPLVVSAENYVTGFLKATVDDSVDIKIYR